MRKVLPTSQVRLRKLVSRGRESLQRPPTLNYAWRKTDDVEPVLSRGILSSFSELSAVKAARCCRLTLGPGHVTVSDLVG